MINKNFKEKLNLDIILLNRDNNNLELIQARYGISENDNLDVTNIMKKYLHYNRYLYLNDGYNNIFGDNYVDRIKFLYLKIKIDNTILNLTYNENQIINIDLKYIKYDLFANNHNGNACISTSYINDSFIAYEKYVKCIEFNYKFYKMFNELKTPNDDINIITIHTRIETDFDIIRDRSKLNYNIEYYKNLLNDYVNNNGKLLILCGEADLLDEIYKDYNYYYFNYNLKCNLIKKYFGFYGREMVAIIDLILAIKYSKIFIGCYDPIIKDGSSYSLFIMQKLDNNIPKYIAGNGLYKLNELDNSYQKIEKFNKINNNN